MSSYYGLFLVNAVAALGPFVRGGSLVRYYILLGDTLFFFFSSRRRHTRSLCDWSSDVCSSDLCRGTSEFLNGGRNARRWRQSYRCVAHSAIVSFQKPLRTRRQCPSGRKPSQPTSPRLFHHQKSGETRLAPVQRDVVRCHLSSVSGGCATEIGKRALKNGREPTPQPWHSISCTRSSRRTPKMTTSSFRAVFLPYCLQRQADGRYAVLNRQYEPVGFFTSDHVAYEAYPILVKIKGLTARKAAAISPNDSSEL